LGNDINKEKRKMVKNRSVIEVEVSGRTFRLECPSEATWEEVITSLNMLNNLSQQTLKAIAASKEEIAQVESLPSEIITCED
jgi:hypothetical protein